jgi:alpha-L-fucosidase
MRYAVLTAKHHDGFCLWDTDTSTLKARQDLIAPYVAACRRHNLRVGLYLSLVDWSHPDCNINPAYGPLHQHPDREAMNKTRNHARYNELLRQQVRELLTRYGRIDILWFDGMYPYPSINGACRDYFETDRIHALVRELMSGVVLNDRLDLADAWDVKTPEGFDPPHWPVVDGQRAVWEACQPVADAWGYSRDALRNGRDTGEIIRTLVSAVSKGGNLLLNVGPDARGNLEPIFLAHLDRIGKWMKLHSPAIHGCTAAPADITPAPGTLYTWNPATRHLFVHLLSWPYRHILLPGLAGRVKFARLLSDGSELPMGFHNLPLADAEEFRHAAGKDSERIILPHHRPDVDIPVIMLEL